MAYTLISRATRRYLFRLVSAMVVNVAFVFFTKWAFQHLHPTGLMMYLLAMLPVLPMVGSLAIVGLYIAEETDEFERFIIVKSVLWGLSGALAFSTICGALEDFAHAPHLSPFYSYLFFWIFMAISGAIIRLRYR
ncbi:hypothetical protein [Edaphobacter albus]|uniref:hypothetical protein n=1 Tax=Edaphobacter sp. 4G125 TaxID=2763071 RepID=UPI00164468C4|nr:hypothetical protein [Edaphobacter sp. 4G125]QNI36551.1 hypothetical protein H7846_16605 [Edaphobacter sp. 4G125]